MQNNHRDDSNRNSPEHNPNQPPTRRRPILDAEPSNLYSRPDNLRDTRPANIPDTKPSNDLDTQPPALDTGSAECPAPSPANSPAPSPANSPDIKPASIPDTEPPAIRQTSPTERLDNEPPNVPDTGPPNRSHKLTPAVPSGLRHPITDRPPIPTTQPIPTEPSPTSNMLHIPRRDKITEKPRANVDSRITSTTPSRRAPRFT